MQSFSYHFYNLLQEMPQKLNIKLEIQKVNLQKSGFTLVGEFEGCDVWEKRKYDSIKLFFMG